MGSPPSNQRPGGHRNGGAPKSGWARQRNPWYPALLTAVGTVVVSVIVLLVVIANASSSGASGSPAVASKGTVTPVATGRTSAVPTPTRTPFVSADPGPGGDATPLVTCGDILAPVDKDHRLGPDCVPPDLVTLPTSISAEGAQQMRAAAATAIEEMFAAAKQAGFTLFVNSGYRSYQTQADTYAYWVRVDGQAYADRTSAKAGHSEHQMGTAADVGTAGHILEGFIGTPAAAWIAANSWKYGFIVSYPTGKESVTGYAAEPWHVRWVGKSVAQQVHDSGLTLHEYLLK